MSLTDYQSAVLQHIGIPVFVAKSENQADNVEQVVSQKEPQVVAVTNTPLNKEEKQARLSALRQVMATSIDETPQPEVPGAESAPSVPEFSPLSASELSISKAIIDDILNATLICGMTFNRGQIVVGEAFQLTPTHLVLPCIPSELTAAHKKALWQVLCEKANSTQ